MKKYKIIFLLVAAFLMSSFIFDGCKESKGGTKVEQTGNKKDVYYCPMHTQVTSDKPGVCPICHMELVKKVDNVADRTNDMDKMVELSQRGLKLANVSTVAVKRENIVSEISAFGYLDFAEPSQKVISAYFNGRIEKMFINATGQYVAKGTPLFEIYSPDLVQAQNEYLIAINNSKGVETASLSNGVIRNNSSLAASARRKLEIMGMTDAQIKLLESTGEVKLTMTYYSPYAGTVIEKKVQEGMYVNEGTPIYNIAEMSVLWNLVEVYADNLSSIKVGAPVSVRIQSYPGEEFPGHVTFIYPVVNQESRTVKVRIEVANRGNKLKPQMYTDTRFTSNQGSGLVVPESAVLFTGKRNIVWIKAHEDMFEPKEIQIGTKFNGYYQILSGLNEGDEVASSGAYLIDSESQLKSGSSPAHQHSGTPEKSSKPESKESMPGMPGM